MYKRNPFIQLWLLIGILMGFLTLVFFVNTYMSESVLCDVDCRVKNEVSLILILLSFFGLFVGSLTYYFISEKYEKKITGIQKDMSATYRFLPQDQAAIIKAMVDAGGSTTQSKIVDQTGLSRVKVSRTLKLLEKKEIIKKSKKGMTNEVELESDIFSLFSKNKD
jgi:uncharacterized membrane protein